VEFSSVELAVPVEKVATSPVEKTTAGRSDGEDGPRWTGGAMEREKDGQPRLSAVEMPAGD
jgi:hypothetical protein